VARGLAPGRTARVEPETVVVALRGPRPRLEPLAAVVAYVDITGMGPGRYTLPVKVDAIAGIEVAVIEPSTVGVQIR
jgi:hypothetical protein